MSTTILMFVNYSKLIDFVHDLKSKERRNPSKIGLFKKYFCRFSEILNEISVLLFSDSIIIESLQRSFAVSKASLRLVFFRYSGKCGLGS